MGNQKFTGHSEKLDFSEALKNAIKQLPAPSGADMLISAKVVEITYTGGGGFSGHIKPKLSVSVESNYH
jgi:hypothetical protein